MTLTRRNLIKRSALLAGASAFLPPFLRPRKEQAVEAAPAPVMRYEVRRLKGPIERLDLIVPPGLDLTIMGNMARVPYGEHGPALVVQKGGRVTISNVQFCKQGPEPAIVLYSGYNVMTNFSLESNGWGPRGGYWFSRSVRPEVAMFG